MYARAQARWHIHTAAVQGYMQRPKLVHLQYTYNELNFFLLGISIKVYTVKQHQIKMQRYCCDLNRY